MSSPAARHPVATGLSLTLAALAGCAVANTVAARLAERRNPPPGRFVELDGVLLHHVDRGEGPPVVLIPGNMATVEDFRISGLVDRLTARRHRVVVIDRPGQGHSTRPSDRPWTPQAQAGLIARAFVPLGLNCPIVLGHSFGALVALALALDHPAAVRGLVLLSGYYYPSTRLDALAVLPLAIPGIGTLIAHTLAPPAGALLLPALVKTMFAPLAVPRRFRSGFPFGLSLRPAQLRAMAEDGAAMVPATEALHERYRDLRVPVAILAGDADRVATADEQSGKLHGEVAHSRYRLMPGVGHMIHHAAPDQVAAAVEALFAEAAQPPAPVAAAAPAFTP
jgi:pimeloyl-ACP methyl ester carboxylesterase